MIYANYTNSVVNIWNSFMFMLLRQIESVIIVLISLKIQATPKTPSNYRSELHETGSRSEINWFIRYEY